MRLSEIAKAIGGELKGKDVEILGVSNLDIQHPSTIAYAENKNNLKLLLKSDISALIVKPDMKCEDKPCVIIKQPKVAFAKILRMFSPYQPYPKKIYPNTYIESSAQLDNDITVMPFSTIMDDSRVGEGTVIYSHVFIGKKVTIGKNCVIKSGVKIDDHTKIGDNVIIHHNAVIGGEGFGFVPDGGNNHKIPQIGTITIGNDVEIGSCVTIDRSTIGETVIGDRVKLDNLVQIAHNVSIGEGTIIASQSAIAGSSSLGKNCLVAGQVGISDHVEIGDNVIIMAKTGIDKKKVENGKILLGTPGRDVMLQRRIYASLERLPELVKVVRKLKKENE